MLLWKVMGLIAKVKRYGDLKGHINVLELRAVKCATLTFSYLHPKAQSMHI